MPLRSIRRCVLASSGDCMQLDSECWCESMGLRHWCDSSIDGTSDDQIHGVSLDINSLRCLVRRFLPKRVHNLQVVSEPEKLRSLSKRYECAHLSNHLLKSFTLNSYFLSFCAGTESIQCGFELNIWRFGMRTALISAQPHPVRNRKFSRYWIRVQSISRRVYREKQRPISQARSLSDPALFGVMSAVLHCSFFGGTHLDISEDL